MPRTVAAYAPIYSVDDFARVAGGRDCLVAVHGNPFSRHGCDDDAFASAVVAAMQRQNLGPATSFTTRPSSRMDPHHHVALLFNGDATLRAADLCSATGLCGETEPLGPNGRFRVLAAWCRDGAVLAEVSGWSEGVRAPGDRHFARLIAQVTRELFPMSMSPGGLKGH
jgi:hypothetical protein